MGVLREWNQCDCKKLRSAGNLKEVRKRGRPQRTWEDWIYTARQFCLRKYNLPSDITVNFIYLFTYLFIRLESKNITLLRIYNNVKYYKRNIAIHTNDYWSIQSVLMVTICHLNKSAEVVCKLNRL
jgi:hypothetical protein